MRTVTVTAGETIQLGYQYDNEATQVVFPDTIVEAITDVYGTTGTFAIWYRRSGDATGYPIGSPLITYSSDEVTWLLTEADMANPGQCQIQLRYIVDEVCVMSQIFNGIVSDSVDIGSEIPAPMEAWADALISAAVSGITDDIKDALLDCFAHVAWIDDQGQTYYDALENALYPPVPVSSVTVTPATFQISSIGGTQQLTATILPSSAQATVTWSSSDTSVATVSESGLVTSVAVGTATITATADGVTGTAACTVALPTLSSISAVYTQSGTVYNTDSLDSLKDDLVVTATWSDSSTSTVPSTDYTLSGTLTEGTSTITVSYGGKTTTFNVTVTAAIPYELYDYVYTPSGTSGVYVDTGLKISPSWNTLNMEFEALNNNGTSNTDTLIGASSYQSSGTATFTWYFRGNKAGFSTFALGTSAKLENIPGNTRAIIKYRFNDGQQSYIQSGQDTVNITTIAKSSVASGNLSLILAGGYSASNGNKISMSAGTGDRLGYVKFTDPENNDALLYHFIPAYDPEEEKYGFYEAVNGVFYPSNSNGLRVGNWQ